MPRRHLPLLIAAAAAFTGATAAPATADAALRIVAPQDQQLVHPGQRIPLRVSGVPRGARLKVWRDGRVAATRRVASISSASLRPGRHTIHVEALRGGRVVTQAARKIVVGRRTNILRPLGSVAARRVLTADQPGGPRALASSSGRSVGVRVRGRALRVRFRLNGHAVPYRFERSERRVHAAQLGPDDGLRFGRNRLVVTAHRADGAYDVERRTLTVRRTGVLAAAGRDRRATAGKRVALDASGSRSAHRRALAYDWRVVAKPAGSRPRLTNSQGMRPVLHPDRPGVYKVAVRVHEAGRGAHAAARAGADALVTVTTTPPVLPAGMPLSIARDNGGGGTITTGATQDDCAAGRFCVVQLDKATLAPLQTVSQASSSSSASAARTAATADAKGVSAYLASDITDNTKPAADIITLQTAPDAGWSAVWVGTSRTIANVGSASAAGWEGGEVAGTLQRDIAGGDVFWTEAPEPRYTYRSTEYIPFFTRTETAKSLTNTIQVGSRPYSVSLPAGTIGGFALLVLDKNADPLPGFPKAYATTTRNSSADPAALAALGNDLDAARKANHTVLLQSIGVPQWENYTSGGNNRQAWDQFAISHLNPLGGTDDYFDALSQSGDAKGGSYALVASPDNLVQPSSGNGEASVAVGTGGSLAGQLTRAPDGTLAPTTTDTAGPDPTGTPAGAGRLDFNALAFGPATAWPAWSGGQAAAASDVQAATKGIVTAQLCPGIADGIRATYCYENVPLLTGTLLNTIKGFKLPSGASYTEGDLDAVQQQYEAEIDRVATVRGWITQFKTLYQNAGLTSLSAANDIQADLVNNIPVQSGGPTVAGSLNAMAGLLALVGGEPELEAGEMALDPMSIGSNGMWTASAVATGAGGSGDPIFSDITTSATTAASSLTASLIQSQDYFERLGDLLVSDPAKLQTAATNIGGTWAFDETQKELANATKIGVRWWLWGSILSSVYRIYYAPTTYGTDPRCVKNYPSDNWSGNLHPFKQPAPAYTWNTHEPLAGVYTWYGRKDVGPYYNNILPPSLSDLFSGADVENSNSTTVGAVREWFAHRWFDWQALPGDIGPRTPNGCGPQNLSPPD